MRIFKKTTYKSKRSFLSRIQEKAKHAYERVAEIRGLHESTKKLTKPQLISRIKKVDKLQKQRPLTQEEKRYRLALKIRVAQKSQQKRRKTRRHRRR